MSGAPKDAAAWPANLGDFRVEGMIARGSSGLVLAGRGGEDSRVAIKLADRPGDVRNRRFRQEIAACQRLDHPGIIRILGAGVHQGRPWYAMDYHGTATLRDLIVCNSDAVANEVPALVAAIERGRGRPTDKHRRLLPMGAAISLITGVGRAIAHAHDRGLVHRDLKPENVLVRKDGRPVVCDFGLVKDLGQQTANTATGRFQGTIGYLAPEQRAGHRAIDERVDIFALGVMLHELVSGVPPVVEAGVQRRQPETRRRVDKVLRLIIHRARHPDPARRYHSMQALVSDLERYQAGERIRATPDPLWLRCTNLVLTYRVRAVTALLLVLLAVGVVIGNWIVDRLDASRWGRPLIFAELRQADDMGELEALRGSWEMATEGLRLTGRDPNIGAIAYRGRLASDLRFGVNVEVVETAGTFGAFIANERGVAEDGYHWLIDSAGEQPARLLRAGRVIWTGELPVATGERYRLEIDLADGRLVGRWNKRDVFVVDDPLPLRQGWCGLTAADDSVRFTGMEVRARTVPALADADRFLDMIGGVYVRAATADRKRMWPDLARNLLRDLQDAPDDRRSRLRAAHLLLQAPNDAARPQGLWETILTGERSWSDTDAVLVRSGHQLPEITSLSGLPELQQHWLQQPDARDRIALWLLRRSQDGRADLLPDLVAWCQQQPPTDAVAIAVADRVLRQCFWDEASWAWALAQCASNRRHPVIAWQAESNGNDVIRRRRHLHAPKPSDPMSAISEYVFGSHELAVFNFELEDGGDGLSASDRHWLDGTRRAVIPELHNWASSLLAAPAGRLTLEDLFRGNGSIPAIIRATPDAEHPAWHRIAACLAILDPAGPGATWIDRQLPAVGLDCWALGLVQRRLRNDAITADESLHYGDEISRLVTTLGGDQPSEPWAVPGWHPSRPTLELLTAWHDLQLGAAAAAERRLQWLVEINADWPESLAARILLER